MPQRGPRAFGADVVALVAVAPGPDQTVEAGHRRANDVVLLDVQKRHVVAVLGQRQGGEGSDRLVVKDNILLNNDDSRGERAATLHKA